MTDNIYLTSLRYILWFVLLCQDDQTTVELIPTFNSVLTDDITETTNGVLTHDITETSNGVLTDGITETSNSDLKGSMT